MLIFELGRLLMYFTKVYSVLITMLLLGAHIYIFLLYSFYFE